jgi:hypothetical protein
VGDYTLTAEVDPRRVDAGGAVSVTVRLEGTGNVPRHVKVPEATGVDWPDPTTSEAITPTDRGIAGWRQFRYVVTLNQPGSRNLGDVTLPYFSPTAGKYQVARAALGNVEVLPGAAPVAPPPAPSAAPPKEAHDDLADLAPRRSLSSIGPEPEPLTERRALWMLLLLGPCLVVLSRVLLSASSRIRGRLARRASSKSALSQKALEEARLAAMKTEPAAVAAAVERAIYWTIEDRLGLKARAVLRGELSQTLESAGGSKDMAEATVALLSECERLRFGGASTEDLTSIASKATRVVGQITRVRGTPRGDLAA